MGWISVSWTKNRLDGLLLRLYRHGYTPTLIGFEQLLRDADEALFQKVLNVEHCLN